MLSVLHLIYNQVISSAERAVLMSWALGLDTSSQLCRWEWWEWWEWWDGNGETVRIVIWLEWWDDEKQCKWDLEKGYESIIVFLLVLVLVPDNYKRSRCRWSLRMCFRWLPATTWVHPFLIRLTSTRAGGSTLSSYSRSSWIHLKTG